MFAGPVWLNAKCVSSAVTPQVKGVKSNRCDPLPVGAGPRSASPLRSSKSRSFTTRSWSNKNGPLVLLFTFPLSTPSLPLQEFLLFILEPDLPSQLSFPPSKLKLLSVSRSSIGPCFKKAFKNSRNFLRDLQLESQS